MSIMQLFLKNVLMQITDADVELTENKEDIECKVKDLATAQTIHDQFLKIFADCDACFFSQPIKKDENYSVNITKDILKHKMALKLHKLFKNEFTKHDIAYITFSSLTFKNGFNETGSFKIPFVALSQKKLLNEILDKFDLRRTKKAQTSSQFKENKEYISFRIIFKEGCEKKFITLLTGQSSSALTSPKPVRIAPVKVQTQSSTNAHLHYLVETKSETPTSPTHTTESLHSPVSTTHASLFHHSTNQDPLSPQIVSKNENIPDKTQGEAKEDKKVDQSTTTVVVKPSGCHCVIL